MNRYQIKLKIRNGKKNVDGTFMIYLYANINGEVKFLTTGHKVNIKHWNQAKEQVSSLADNWSTINSDINVLKNTAIEFLSHANVNKRRVTVQDLERELRKDASFFSYYAFVEKYIREKGHQYSPHTVRNWRCEISTLKSYSPKLSFSDIHRIWWNGFENFLEAKGNSRNTIHKFYKNIKRFVNKAIEQGITDDNPLKSIEVKQTEGKFVFLDKSDLKKLEALYQSGIGLNSYQYNVLRYFLFACYTGLRYSDISGLRFEHLKNLDNPNKAEIVMEIFKTKSTERIPLNKKAINLLPEVTLPKVNVFKVLTNQPTNRRLKEIMSIAGINKPVSFHVARHTAATILLSASGNIEAVRKILGHKEIKTTEIYAKLLEEDKRKVIEMLDAI